jgi:hypothetical protein
VVTAIARAAGASPRPACRHSSQYMSRYAAAAAASSLAVAAGPSSGRSAPWLGWDRQQHCQVKHAIPVRVSTCGSSYGTA